MGLREKIAERKMAKAAKQQQRAANKKQHYKLDKYAASMAINTMIIKCSTEPQDEQAHCDLMARARAAKLALTGTETAAPWCETDHFIDLNEMNVFGFELAKLLYDNGTERTKELIAPFQKVFETAAEALAQIGERKNVKGVYRATGDELSALNAAFNDLDDLVLCSTQGLTLTALINSKTLVQKALNETA